MRFLKAEAVFNGSDFLEKGNVLVLNEKNQLETFLDENAIDDGRVEKLQGILCPGFVNTHCHLELSHLKGRIAERTGLVGFGKSIMSFRNSFTEEEIREHMQDADRSMLQNGIVAVGDISNQAISFETKASSSLYYHTFIELIGLSPGLSQQIFDQGKDMMNQLEKFGLKGSLSPHAPYSVSKELMLLIAKESERNNLPLSIHNQESEEELRFLEGKESAFYDLYRFLNQDISWFRAPGISGPEYLAELLPARQSILVHNTFTDQKAIQKSGKLNNYWCFCPNANRYIENTLPDFSGFKEQEKRICLGTDSLASNHQLDLISEANLLLSESEGYSISSVLSMLTVRGAQALRISEQFGSLLTGKNAGLNLISHSNNQLKLIRKIT